MAVIKANVEDLITLCGGAVSESNVAGLLDKVGAPLDEREGDTLYIEVTPDRPDYLAVEGIAYSLRSYAGIHQEINKNIKKSSYSIDVDNAICRPYIASLVARNVKLNLDAVESLMQLQEKMHETFGRKRRKIAIGMHNLDSISGKEIKYYDGNGDEKFIPLFETKEMSLREMLSKTEKGRDYASLIEDRFPIVSDSSGIIAAPPILNSERTKIDEHTSNIFVDITGINRNSVENAAAIVALALAMRGGEIESVDITYKQSGDHVTTPNLNDKLIQFNLNSVNKLLGSKFTCSDVADLLLKTGMQAIKKEGNKITAAYPAWRVDVYDDSDIAEEIAIAHGYNEFAPAKPEMFTIGRELNKKRALIQELMIGMGFKEICTFVLTNEDNEFKMLGIDSSKEKCVKIANPLTVEHTIIRKSIIPSMLRTIATNKKHKLPVKLFEIGEVVDENGGTNWVLCAAIYDELCGMQHISGVFNALISKFSIEYSASEHALPYMIPGRCAKVEMKNGIHAVIGEVHPQVLKNHGLEFPVGIVEVNIKGF